MVTITTIKKGYKQTELGIIPEDWDIKELGNLADVKDGTHQTPKYFDSGVPFYSVESVTNNDFTNTKYISEAEHKILTKNFRIEKMDILMTRIGSIGDCKLVNWEPRASFYVSLALLKPKDKLNAPYIYNFSKTNIFKKELEDRSLLWAVPKKINLGEISKVKIIIPKAESEKKLIVNSLSDTDELIEHLEKLLEKKKAIKQGTMQQLLTGKKRLPGFSGKWEIKKLGEISNIKTGKKNNDDKMSEGLYPFFVRSQQIERINSYSFDGEAILIPGEGNIGNIYHYINGKFDYHQRVYKISNFTKEYSGKFIYLSMFQNFNIHAMKNSVKATVDSLRLPTFQEYEILFPPTKDEQISISNIIFDMDLEIENLEKKRDKYIMVKQGMMQQLLTGKIRIYGNN